MELKDLVIKLQKKSVEYEINQKKLIQTKLKIRKLEKLLTYLNESKIFLIELAKQSQNDILKYIEEITTLAIQTVYGKEFSFKIEKPEGSSDTHMFICEKGIEYNPRDESTAGGILDMTSLGLQASVFSLCPDIAPILFLDEPFRFLGNYTEQGGELLKKIQEILGIQIVIITHNLDVTKIGEVNINLERK